jgi:hypothetical protein
MTQALVYSGNISNVAWNTDKAEIATSTASASWNVYLTTIGNTVGIVGDVTAASNVMITTNAGQQLVGATFVTGPGVANTTTVISAVNGQSLTMSANASATLAQSQYTLTTGNSGNMYSNSPIVPPYRSQQVYVGVGNKLTATSNGVMTIREIGTNTSGSAGH